MLLHRSREHTYHQMRTDALEDKKNDCWIKKKVSNQKKQIYFQHYWRKQFRTMKKGNHFTTDRCFKAFTQITLSLHASSFNLLRTNSNFLFLIGFVYNFCRSLQILWSPFVVWSPCKAECFTFIPWYKISGDINERTLVIRGNLRTLRYKELRKAGPQTSFWLFSCSGTTDAGFKFLHSRADNAIAPQ